jgi:hypothetical protein
VGYSSVVLMNSRSFSGFEKIGAPNQITAQPRCTRSSFRVKRALPLSAWRALADQVYVQRAFVNHAAAVRK